MNVGEIRDYVRTQLDVDEEEYPNDLIDAYLDEAFTRTVAMEPRWPTYETVWTVTKPADSVIIEPPADLNIACVDSLIDQSTGRRLLEIAPEMAEDYLLTAGVPNVGLSWFTTYGGTITLWPQFAPGGEQAYTLRGQRMAAAMGVAASDEPDCDVRLHRAIVNYVIALMYANQEDEILEDTYMKRWQANFGAARRSILTARNSRPVVFNGGLRTSFYHDSRNPSAVWDI